MVQREGNKRDDYGPNSTDCRQWKKDMYLRCKDKDEDGDHCWIANDRYYFPSFAIAELGTKRLTPRQV